MKKLLIILLLFVTTTSFAQTEDPFVGTWVFAVNHKIDYNAMLDTAKAHGYDISDENNRAMLFRCCCKSKRWRGLPLNFFVSLKYGKTL